MKAVFINPPVEDFYATSVRRQPLGLLYVAAAVRAAGFEVELINGHTPRSRPVPVPEEFRYLEKYRAGGDPSLSFPFAHYRHFGMSFAEMAKRIARAGADAFFISSLFTPYHRECDAVIRIARDAAPSVPIAVGGHHAAINTEYYLEDMDADFVVTGEGEESAAGLMRALAGEGELTQVPNLAYMDEGYIVRTPRRAARVDTLPLPARDLLSARDFRAYGKKAVSMVASRGCPNRCDFCASRAMWGDGYRAREAGAVIEEIRECVGRHCATMINFEDDNLMPARGRAIELLECLASFRERECPELDLAAMNGVSIEGIDPDIIGLMCRAGFRELNISLMSHAGHLQRGQHRPFDSDRFAAVAVRARAAGMNVRAYFILGLPGQTAEEARATIAFIRDLGAAVFPSVYYNVYAPRKEWMMQRSSAFFNETDGMSRDDLVRIFNECVGAR